MEHRGYRKQWAMYANLIESAFASGHTEQVEALLRTLEPRLLGVHSLIGIPRATYRAREVLPSWERVYQECRSLLIARGQDAAKLFVGMEIPNEHAQDTTVGA